MKLTSGGLDGLDAALKVRVGPCGRVGPLRHRRIWASSPSSAELSLHTAQAREEDSQRTGRHDPLEVLAEVRDRMGGVWRSVKRDAPVDAGKQ